MSSKLRFGNFSFLSKDRILILLIAGLLSGCSSDFSRFTDGITPSHKKAPVQQADAYPPAPAQGAPVSKVESSNLAPPPAAAPAPVQTAQSGGVSSHPVSQNLAVRKTQPASGSSSSTEAKEGRRTITYTVASGDSLIGIAERYHVLVAAIKRDNNLKSDKILVKQKLVIKNAKPVSGDDSAKKAESKPAAHSNALNSAAPASAAVNASSSADAKSPASAPADNNAVTSENGGASQTAGNSSAGNNLAAGSAAASSAGAASAGISDMGDSAKSDNAANNSQSSAGTAQPAPAANSQNPSASGNAVNNNQDEQSSSAMIWPVRGNTISSYGQRAGTATNDGIDIAVPEGTPVKAAAAGQVIYAGDGLKEFGNTILIRHEDNVVTVYGHNSKLLVQRGQQVQKGQDIALSGSSGNASVAKLHFEVRKNSAPVNPMNYLPSTH